MKREINKNIVAESIKRFIVHSIKNEEARQIGQSFGDRSQGGKGAGRAWPRSAVWGQNLSDPTGVSAGDHEGMVFSGSTACSPW
jgi:hypothetical protein